MLTKKRGFYCFSPPVMLATFAIEVGLLVYVLYRYKLNAMTRLVALLLTFLAIFQLSEYNVCGGLFSLNAETWSRIGYVSITALPPIALHLVLKLAKVAGRWRYLTTAGYLASTAWAIFFTIAPSAFDGHVCAGNYAIFQIGSNAGGAYFAYYYLMLFVGIGLCLYFIPKVAKLQRLLLTLQLTGYLSFLLPTAITNTVRPETIQGIPSIMCGFAIVYALIVALYMTPRMQAKKRATVSGAAMQRRQLTHKK